MLRLLEANPQMSQRELAAALGVSLGKTNFCLKALLDKGLLKMRSALKAIKFRRKPSPGANAFR